MLNGFYALTRRSKDRKIERSQPSAAPTFKAHFPVGAAEGCDLFIVHELLFRKPAIISWQNAAQRCEH
jgi:hypothetical protein